jgi:hypothetical protein
MVAVRVRYKDGQFIKAGEAWEKLVAHAATAGVRDCGKAAQEAGRNEIASHGFTSRRWKTSIVSVMHPKGGAEVLNPWAWVHSKINFADVFETGKTISKASFLWLPLPSVPNWPGDPSRQMSAKKYIQTYGPGSLRSALHRGSKSPLLLGKTAATSKPQPFGKFGRPLKRGSNRAARWIPMFVGVRQVVIRQIFDVSGAIKRVAADLPKYYLDNMKEYVDPNGD